MNLLDRLRATVVGGPPVSGRHRAPAMVERDRHGRPLPRPFPVSRRVLRVVIVAAGLVGATFVERDAIPVALFWTGVAALLVPRLLAPTPYPAFLSLGREQAHALLPQTWVRLRGGYAVQAMNVHVRLPDTVGDPTPPLIQVRFSDDVTRTFRPHDVLQVVQPVDLRSPTAAARARPR